MKTRIKCITTKFKTNNFNAFGNMQVMVKISDNNFKIHLPYRYISSNTNAVQSMGFVSILALVLPLSLTLCVNGPLINDHNKYNKPFCNTIFP